LRLSLTPAKVESEDSGPGVTGPSSLVTEGRGELVPVSVMSHRSIADVAGSSLSHPDTAGLMGATLRVPIASSPQMLGSIGAAFNPDVLVDVETGYGAELEAGSEVQPTQPPHPPVVVDTSSGYPEDSDTVMGDVDMPDIANIYRDFSVDVTPLVSVSISGIDSTSGPELSVAASIAITSGAYTAIQNPSLAPNVGHASLGDTASGMLPPTALGRYTEPNDFLLRHKTGFGPVLLREIEVLIPILIFR